MAIFVATLFLLILLIILVFLVAENRRNTHCINTIQSFALPDGCMEKLQQKHPHLSPDDCAQVELGLRQFFMVYFNAKGQYVAMPSQVLDDLWHEFISYRRDYANFCQQAFGEYFDYYPAVMAQADGTQLDGLHKCWHEACELEGIAPVNVSRFPLLFAIDAQLKIKDGLHFSLYPVEPASARIELQKRLSDKMLAGALRAIPVAAFAMPIAVGSDEKSNARSWWRRDGGGGGCGGGCGGG